jgi:hypothetical protein
MGPLGRGSTPAADQFDRTNNKMLSKALMKAHTAVHLDNAHEFESAIRSYRKVCEILDQIRGRVAGEAGQGKLNAISTTYSNRGAELIAILQEREDERRVAEYEELMRTAPPIAALKQDEELDAISTEDEEVAALVLEDKELVGFF